MQNQQFLICRVGAVRAALALNDVRETMRPLPITAILGSPSFVRGLAIVRGVMVPVLDAALLLGEYSASQISNEHSTARFISVNVPGRNVVLAVDQILGIQELAAELLANIPSLLAEAGREVISGLARLDDELLLILRTARLLPEAAWPTIERATAAA